MGKKDDLSKFKHGMVVVARRAGLGTFKIEKLSLNIQHINP